MSERRETWRHLATPSEPVGVFDADDLRGLPSAARSLLAHALAPGVALHSVVTLEMEGEIKLKRWMPFRARQVLRAGSGFVWEATVGRAPVRIRGGDTYFRGVGTLAFKLWGLVRVAHATGPDIDRSAAGRLAAETVAWAPQALIPRMGASWAGGGPDGAVVTLPIGEDPIEVAVVVEPGGRLRELSMQRWGDPDSGGFAEHRFGASVDSLIEVAGVTIAGAGGVGWWWGTPRQEEGEFFRYRITDAAHGGTDPARPR